MAWALLILAGLFEIGWALALKESDSLTKLWPTVGFVCGGTASIVLLILALRDLPVGTAYAVWTGIGAAGTALFGILILSDSADPLRLLSIAAIVGGVAGLYLLEGS